MSWRTGISLTLIAAGTVSILYGLGTETELVVEVVPPILLYILGIPILFYGIHLVSTGKTRTTL